jgi:nickel transport system substrate-binding protein
MYPLRHAITEASIFTQQLVEEKFLMSRIFLCYLSGLLIFLFAAVPQAFAEDDTLVYSWSSNVGELNPHVYSPNQMFAQALLYESLVKYGEGNKVIPCLAEKWTISADSKVYTFELRKDVKFTDGTSFNAEAVRKNFEAVMMNRERHKWLELVAQIDKVEVVDEFTFRLTMKNPYYPTLQELCLIRPLRFMSPAAMPEDGNTSKGIKKAVGTGPWMLVDSRKGEFYLFERNDNYWGTKPKFRKLLIKVISDPITRAVAMETGEIDLIHGTTGQISLDAFERFTKMPDFVTQVSQPLASRVVALNSKRGPTADLAVRRAIQHAINKAALVKSIFYGVEQQADTLFSTETPYCDLGLKPYVFDRQLAEKQLDKAGWKQAAAEEIRHKDGQELAIDFCFVGNDAQQKAIAEAMQGDLKKIGIKINMIGEEPDSNINRQRTGEFGMVFNETWGAPYDPHSFCSSMRAPSHADYQAQIGLPMKAEIDTKIGEALLSTDETQRQELFKYILTNLHEQAVYLPLTYVRGVIVHRKDLKGVRYGQLKEEIPFELIERD